MYNTPFNFLRRYGKLRNIMAVELLNEKLVRREELSIAYAGWGKPVTNGDLSSRFSPEVLASSGIKDFKSFMAETGINMRFSSPIPRTLRANRDEIREEMIEVGTALIQRVLSGNGWNGADQIYITTSTPMDEEGLWTKEIARRCNIQPDAVNLRLLACDGAAAALLDVMSIKELKNAKVVIAAIEVLGEATDQYGRPKEAVIFGNGAAAMAFRPRSFRFFNGGTVINHDTNGVLSSPLIYDLPKNRIQNPPQYRVMDGGENVFACSGDAVVLTLPRPQDPEYDYLVMKPMATAAYFGRLVPQVQIEVLKAYYDKYGKRTKSGEFRKDTVVDLIVSHQPSKGVKQLVETRLAKLLEEAKLPPVRTPWVLDKAGMSNVSSATILIVLAELLPTIKRGHPFGITSYGIGSAVTSGVYALRI